MRNTLRKQIINGLYENDFEIFLLKGYSYKQIADILEISDYVVFNCKWHLYQKYKVFNKKDLIEKIKVEKILYYNN